MNDFIPIQRTYVLFQKFGARRDHSIQLSPFNLKWAWLTHHIKSNRVQAQQFGLNMISLPNHTSYALQPLNVSRFKPFKIVFRKKDGVTINNNYAKVGKIIFFGWVDKALD
jgi:hypothetical protein